MGRVARVVWALVGVVALVGGGLGVREFLSPDGYPLVAEFDDVGDLVERHSVQIADVRIGEVTSIDLTDDFRARVTMRVNDGIDVPAGTTAVLRTTSLLGEKFIELRPPSEEAMLEGPYLAAGATIEDSETAPEVEFVADTAIELLGAVEANDLATLIDAGGVGFGGQREELRSLVNSLGTISGTLAERSDQLVRIIDHLDGAAGQLASGTGSLRDALGHLAETTGLLAENRDRAVEALEQLSRLAAAQNTVVVEHFDEVNTQIGQVDDILAQLADRQDDIDSLLVWLERFVVTIPDVIPNDFTTVFQHSVLRGSEAD